MATKWYRNAPEKFKVGQRVVSTPKAIQNGVMRKETFGRVTKIGESWPFWDVFVLRDGLKHPVSYHMDFWEPTRRRAVPRG